MPVLLSLHLRLDLFWWWSPVRAQNEPDVRITFDILGGANIFRVDVENLCQHGHGGVFTAAVIDQYSLGIIKAVRVAISGNLKPLRLEKSGCVLGEHGGARSIEDEDAGSLLLYPLGLIGQRAAILRNNLVHHPSDLCTIWP